MKLDQIDRKILANLQAEARITNAELADRVGLSPTPCLRRVRRLEADGVIKGYHAALNREALDFNVDAFAMVKLEREDERTLRRFEEALKARPEVLECYLVTGKFDYVLRIAVPSLAAYEALLSDVILKLPNVETVESTFTLRQIKTDRTLPIDKALGG